MLSKLHCQSIYIAMHSCITFVHVIMNDHSLHCMHTMYAIATTQFWHHKISCIISLIPTIILQLSIKKFLTYTGILWNCFGVYFTSQITEKIVLQNVAQQTIHVDDILRPCFPGYAQCCNAPSIILKHCKVEIDWVSAKLFSLVPV